jgi:DNA invertase Pin-like site-specific DNA recombinase
MAKRTIIFARFSPRPDEDESQSNEKQIERCREYAEAHGYIVGGIFQDRAISGGDDDERENPAEALANRPGLLDAIRALRKGDVLLVRWRSRIARDVYLQEWVRRKVAKAGATIEAADEPNGETPSDRFVQHVFAGLAEMQRMEIKLNTSRAMRAHQAKGRRMGRIDRCPFGQRASSDDPARLVEDANEQAIILEIIALRARGATYRAICRSLDDAGYRRRGKRWTGCPTMVKTILKRAGAE